MHCKFGIWLRNLFRLIEDRIQLPVFNQGRININAKKVAVCICVLLVTLSVLAIILEYTVHNNGSTSLSRVACIGDSITDLPYYPDELQRLLGTNYTVGNFGVSSATALLDTDKSYMDQIEFVEAKEFLPDIVIIMLGTNDAREDHFESIGNFVSDYTKLVNEFQALDSNPKIFLAKPPPLFDNEFGLKNENLVEEIIPRIEQIADDEGLTVIDVYGALENHREYFWDDGVHPTDEGGKVIANTIYEAVILSAESS
jgi:lysophospholipase L1-like esterase